MTIRVPPSKRNGKTPVERYFDGIYYAMNYSRFSIALPQRLGLFRRGSETVASECLRLVSAESPATILDLGCGTGSLIQLFLGGAGVRQVTGVDSSPRTIMAARRELGHSERVAFELGTLEECHALETEYDAVVSVGVFDYTRIDGRILARLLSATRRVLVLNFPLRMASVRRIVRRTWLKLNGIVLCEYDVDEIARVANAVAADEGDHWKVQIGLHPERFDGIWLRMTRRR